MHPDSTENVLYVCEELLSCRNFDPNLPTNSDLGGVDAGQQTIKVPGKDYILATTAAASSPGKAYVSGSPFVFSLLGDCFSFGNPKVRNHIISGRCSAEISLCVRIVGMFVVEIVEG